MGPIGPGDWVECLGYSLGNRGYDVSGPKPERGRVYQVEAVVKGALRDGSTEPALRLVGWHQMSERGARVVYHVGGFRPIYRPREALIQQLMQPVREDESWQTVVARNK